MTFLDPNFVQESERLRLVMPVPEIIPAWHKAVTDLSPTQQNWLPAELQFNSLEDVTKLIYTQMAFWVRGEDYMFAITDKEQAFLGALQIHPSLTHPSFYELGYFLAPNAQGNGYMKEAIHTLIPWVWEHLTATRLTLACDIENHASMRLAKACGFTQEGTFKNARTLADGRLVNEAFWALTRP